MGSVIVKEIPPIDLLTMGSILLYQPNGTGSMGQAFGEGNFVQQKKTASSTPPGEGKNLSSFFPYFHRDAPF